MLVILLLGSACRPRARIPPGPTPVPTDPLFAVPSDVPTAVIVVPTEPTIALSSAVPQSSSTPPALTITDKGVIVFQLTDATSEIMASLEMSPNPAKRELLVNLHDGVSAYVDRIRWSGAVPDRERIGQEVSQARYAPDAQAIVFNGLLLDNGDGKPRQTIAPDGITPAWSPDGKRIAFMRRAPTTGQCGNDALNSCVSVILYDVLVHTESVIVTAPDIGGPPTWSPDGKYLLVSLGGETGSALGLIETASGKLSMLVPNPDTPFDDSNYTNAVWMADSSQIIYTTAGGSMWAISPTGGAPTHLSDSAAFPFVPPKGQWVYYLATRSSGSDPAAAYQEVWRLDPANPAGAERVLDTPMSCNNAGWTVDLLACMGTVDNRQTITLYALPTMS